MGEMAPSPFVTWRLTIPPAWGGRVDRSWLPAVGADQWRSIFDQEDFAGRVLHQHGPALGWRAAAEAVSLLSSVPAQYRLYLRLAEEEAVRCEHATRHLDALTAAGRGAEPPARTHPPGPWRLRALVDGRPVTGAHHPSVDGAEGDAVARRTGFASLACWAEPDPDRDRPDPDLCGPVPGWRPQVDHEVRRVAFAVEDAVASVCRAAASAFTGPDVIDARLLCLLGEAAYRSILEYRTLLAGIWTDLEACPHHDEHESGAEQAMADVTVAEDVGPTGPWRHVRLLGGGPVEVAVHDGQANAAAAVAAARLTEETGIHWAEPVISGSRRDLSSATPPRYG